mgnify:CR=1 FL=1
MLMMCKVAFHSNVSHHLQALEIIANALRQPKGEEAMNYLVAQEYVKSVAAGLGKSSTVFLQHDVTDIAKMVAQGLSVMKNMTGNKNDTDTLDVQKEEGEKEVVSVNEEGIDTEHANEKEHH